MNLLITGGTGSLGQELTKHILTMWPMYEKIVIYSRDEQKQELMQSSLAFFQDNHKLRFLIGDVRDKERLGLAMQNINAVVHCAALKIVPALEFNPMEAVKTNVIGTQNLIEVCASSPTIRTVLAVSTDKAVHPVNLYGATKLCMEKLILAANNIQGDSGPRYGIVRYGNVAGSRGSVIHKFKEAVANNQPMHLTHRDMTRFWITIEEAAEFVAGALYSLMHDDPTRLFIPEMKAFEVRTLARAIAGRNQKIKVVGVRPGEKIHEQIMTAEEAQKLDLDYQISTSNQATMMGKKELQEKLIQAGLLGPIIPTGDLFSCPTTKKKNTTTTRLKKSPKRAKSTSKKVT